jgi:hypothetical protein
VCFCLIIWCIDGKRDVFSGKGKKKLSVSPQFKQKKAYGGDKSPYQKALDEGYVSYKNCDTPAGKAQKAANPAVRVRPANATSPIKLEATPPPSRPAEPPPGPFSLHQESHAFLLQLEQIIGASSEELVEA